MKLTRCEQETIISYNNDEKTASIYTADKTTMNRLQKLCEKSTAIIEEKRDGTGRWYICPKKWVRVQMSRVLTDEQKQKQASRLRAARDKKDGGTTRTRG